MSAATVSPVELAQLGRAVSDIARRAGAAILEVYEGEPRKGAAEKGDGSPLTLADLRAHDVIVHALRALTPQVPVLSEEDAHVPWVTRSTWARHWLVDPLDGTREFLARNGEFTVNIALVVDHRPVLGVVYVPVGDVLYMGTTGSGATRTRGAAGPESIAVAPRAAVPVRVVGSRSHGVGSLDAFLAALGPHELQSIGSSLKLCRVAEGAADLYPRLGPTSEWDTAAAHAVVIAAGGQVVKLDGSPLAYNAKAELLNPHFLVYADASRDWLACARP